MEECADDLDLLLVELEDGGTLQAGFDNLEAIEVLTKVDVVDALGVRIHRVEELEDGGTAYGAALSKRTEAYGTCALGNSLELVGPGDVVPCYVLADLVCGNAIATEGYLYGASGISYTCNATVELDALDDFENLVTQCILTYSRDNDAVPAELTRVICKIGWSASKLAAFGETIPKCFANAYD